MAFLMDRWAKGGIFAGVLVAALGGAVYAKSHRTRASTVTAEPAAGANAAAEGEPGAPGACETLENGQQEVARVLPILVSKMELSQSEQREAGAIMAARVDAMRALPKTARNDTSEQALAAGQKAKEIDRDARTKLAAFLGKERGKQFYTTYIRSDAHLHPSTAQAATPASR